MLNKKDVKFFKEADRAALLSDFANPHIGCVAVYHGLIIGTGCNTNKTHPKQDYYNRYRNKKKIEHYSPKLHAEISCLNSIRNMHINFGKVKLYIYRKRVDQPFGIARPCPSCMQAIKDLGIKEIYYTTDKGYAFEKILI